MNIFVLDPDPVQAAIYHCDKHVVKMVLESAQMLCTNLNLLHISTPYLSVHKNHPCTIWARETRENFIWLCELGLSLGMEYTHRYGKTHSSEKVIEHCYSLRHHIPQGRLTKFAQAMPDVYKCTDSVQAYRNYYMGDKKDFAIWSKREVPEWFEVGESLLVDA
jgi:hypothetical protein